MPVILGTSGWHYADWRPRFYPANLGPARWLPYYAERFGAVEVNNAFYRLPERSTFERWGEVVPRDFVVAVKASRYLTHVKRLQDPDEPIQRLMERATALGDHLGPVLLQFPPTLHVDADLLDAALAAFPRSVRVAVEPRHDTWFVDEIREVLESRGAALCLADGGPVEVPRWRTADWSYVRFHRGRGRPAPCYRRRDLQDWAHVLAGMWGERDDVYCFFNNDTNGCALRDARWMAGALQGLDRSVTRVPAPSETRVGDIGDI